MNEKGRPLRAAPLQPRASFDQRESWIRSKASCNASSGAACADSLRVAQARDLGTIGVETDRLRAHIRAMSGPRYLIHEADDGTFTVEIYDGIGADAVIPKFDSRKQAEDWIAEERRKLGINGRWRAIDD
jgi:hypothetical protein